MKIPCTNKGCDGKGDNCELHEDGSTYCFGCGKVTFPEEINGQTNQEFLCGKILPLPRRGISERVCRFFDYQIAPDGKHITNYKNSKGEIINQKIRGANKKFYWTKKGIKTSLYGQWLYKSSEHVFVTVVEGEIDCLSVAEVQGLQYPVVSVPLGAGSAKESLEKALTWLAGFKHVVLAFDNDEAGRRATEDCKDLLEPGKIKTVVWPLKDANEMLVQGRGNEIKNLLFNAKDSYEEHLVSTLDIIDEILEQPKCGIDFPYPTLTKMTYGFRLHELYIFVGANGVGKTELMKEIMFNFLEKDLKIGLFSFEQRAASTGQRLVGSLLNRKLHIPGEWWDKEEIRKHATDLNDKIFLCKNAGSRSVSQICNDIRYWVKAKGVGLIIIDNLKGLCRNCTDENKSIKQAMLTFQALVQELDVTIFLISHVSKDKMSLSTYVTTSPKNPDAYFSTTAEDMESYTNKPGLSWEAGRMPIKENVEGSSTICDLADYVFALARDSVNEDKYIQSMLRIKCLKERFSGQFTGHVFKLTYQADGRLVESTTSTKDAYINVPDLMFKHGE